jgi:4-hydroxyphenylpyruvate dioxygenase
LIYFLDRQSALADVWNIEFDRVNDAGAEAGLIAIDHISQSMEYDEMLSWLLFYTGILDVSKTPSLDIADPGGLVRSQVVQNADGSLRIPLNGSQSQRTLSGRFINEFFGSGVQHIAFATADIRAIAEKLSHLGLHALPVPENYYDDLVARFALEDSFVAAIARHNILYDRDQTGEYLQLYTPTFADRFFFEIVERRGYTGFGAPNAPVRLAAQARLSKGQFPFD